MKKLIFCLILLAGCATPCPPPKSVIVVTPKAKPQAAPSQNPIQWTNLSGRSC